MTQQDQDHAKQQAEAQLSSIREMMAAASLDWERLDELREERARLVDEVEEAEAEETNGEEEKRAAFEARASLAAWDDENAEELAELEAAAGEYTSQEDAEEAIYNDPLCVDYRSGWSSDPNHLTPEDFQILLCTGGPAVRIMGELDFNGQPHRAWLEYQDWGTPWTMLFDGQEDALAYAQRLIVL